MSEPTTAVSDDALKLLVAEHGVRGTARLLGMDERQTHAFRQRVTRGKWLDDPSMKALRVHSEEVGPGRPSAPVVAKMSPVAALQAEIAALGAQTKYGLAKGMASAAAVIQEMPGAVVLENAQNVKSVAQTASLVHNWDRQSGTPKIRLELLANKGDIEAIEVEAEPVSDDWLDEY